MSPFPIMFFALPFNISSLVLNLIDRYQCFLEVKKKRNLHWVLRSFITTITPCCYMVFHKKAFDSNRKTHLVICVNHHVMMRYWFLLFCKMIFFFFLQDQFKRSKINIRDVASMRCSSTVSAPVQHCCAPLTAHHSRYIAVQLLTNQVLYFIAEVNILIIQSDNPRNFLGVMGIG